MLGRTDRRLRMIALLLVFTLFGTAVALRLGYWQVMAAPELRERAKESIARPAEPEIIRGDILDRNGVALAQTIFRDRLVAFPDLIDEADRGLILAELAAIMEISPDKAERDYGERLSSGAHYEILEPQIGATQSLAVEAARAAGRLPGVALEWHQLRNYPNPGGEPDTTLASQLLGFVDAEGRGRNGVEQAHDDRLMARSGPGPVDLATLGTLSGAGSVSAAAGQLGTPPVRLTIDAALQLQLETELHTARIANRAERVSGLIMDPATGAILAWASVPGYDANEWRDAARRGLDRLRDPIAADSYAPGSVMKPLTAAAALSRGVVTPRTIVVDTPKLVFEGAVVRNADHKSMGRITVRDAIAYSRNVATARIAARLGPTTARAAVRLYQTWENLGIGRPTGVDVAGETAGIAPDPRKSVWVPVDLANRAFGQGLTVTLIQLAAAYAPMINGGFLVRPHVAAEGAAAEAAPERVLKPEVSRQLRDILVYVTGAVPWYARAALIQGYQIGGKTGTAQIWDAARREFREKAFDFSFVGFVGGDKPVALIAVRIQAGKPKITGQGELELKVSSSQLFRKIGRAAIRDLAIPRSSDPDAGFPIRGSQAEREIIPKRYEQHKKEALRQQRTKTRSNDADGASRARDRADRDPERGAPDRKTGRPGTRVG